jgi:hypothetical protein
MKSQEALTNREKAINLLQSMRGQYIISQALCLAIKMINCRPPELQEPSNVKDMEFLVQNLFPIYRAVESAEEKFYQQKTDALKDE